ncbi:nucleotidyltransferase family protein [Geomesophilobacter sediminis]|uniref:Nucleotidyltransferase family protein n=1 Tax=Geomesophilobacter sediminis TaxID=2798584 RepID=A0A8J7J4P0_9BACT|nr:nucleotidyltransferase family protein [Geomesophilobacter sediminis]MBJ6723161.1 nucleotidyltransferase family protein [Geomesophilobacter sediminis]
MKSWKNILIEPDTPVVKAMEIIDASALQIALVVDAANRLLGTVTDGDIRRGILNNVGLNEPVRKVMFNKPSTARIEDGRESILSIMKARMLRQIPVLDRNGCVVGLEIWDDLMEVKQRDNAVLLMAGGLGSRLGDLTKDCPKPLLKVGDKPVLEIILENCIEYGLRKFFLSVNYKAHMVQDYFGDGARWGVEISYVQEEKRLGTAGALGILPFEPTLPLLVMNADVLTKINLQHLLDFHTAHQAVATMCVREYDFQVPYGVVKLDQHRLVGIEEKPVQSFFVSAGIYVLDALAFKYIPRNEFYDMPTLFEKIIAENHATAAFPVHEYWLDIGRLADYERANGEYSEVFK